MHTDMAKLKGKIAERLMTQEEVAARIGVDSSTFSRKMKANGLTFTVEQMHKIAEVLSLSNQEECKFFCSKTRIYARNESSEKEVEHMKIEATPEEIAALVVALQERQSGADSIVKEIATGLESAVFRTQPSKDEKAALESGEISINVLRTKHGLSPIEGGDELTIRKA